MTGEKFDELRAEFDARLSAYTPMLSANRWWLEVVRNIMILAAIKYVEIKADSAVIKVIYIISMGLMGAFLQGYVVIIIETFFPKFRPNRQLGFIYYMGVVGLFIPITLLLNFGLQTIVTEISTAQWAQR
jgi:hypothetical protein